MSLGWNFTPTFQGAKKNTPTVRGGQVFATGAGAVGVWPERQRGGGGTERWRKDSETSLLGCETIISPERSGRGQDPVRVLNSNNPGCEAPG